MVDILVWNVRNKKHISLRQLAALSGISKSGINQIENKMKNPTIDTLCALARALQVPVTDLFYDPHGIKA